MTQVLTTAQIHLVEKALGFHLHLDQLSYLRFGTDRFLYRSSGRTTMYIVRLLLTEGPPIKRREVGKFSDRRSDSNYSNYWFVNQVKHIKDKLDSVGLKTREII